MAKKDVAVLDFGSSKLTLLIGRRAVNNNFIISASSDIDYAGFMEGEFIEEETLKDNIGDCIKEVTSGGVKLPEPLYIGVPGEFCQVNYRVISKIYNKRVRLTDKHIDNLFVDADNNVISNTHSVINISPLYYELDDNNITNEPIDSYCKSIKVHTCFTMADNRFILFIAKILKDLKINNFEFVCSTLAESDYLLTDEIKNNGALLVDVGFITTNIAYCLGEGITELRSISTGGGQITASISEGLKLPFSVAEQVKEKLLITVKSTGLDYYEVYRNNRLEKVPATVANEIALKQIDAIIAQIEEEINAFEQVPDENETLYLTGGGLAFLKGIEYYMSRVLGRKVVVIKPKPVKLAKPDLSSVIGLLDTALKMEER